METVTYHIIMTLIISLPLLILFTNIYLLVVELFDRSKARKYKSLVIRSMDLYALITGIPFTLFLWSLANFSEYDEALRLWSLSGLHTPLAGRYIVSFLFPVIMGYIGYFYLRSHKSKLAPLLYILAISAMIIAGMMQVVYIYQFSTHVMSIDLSEGILKGIISFLYNPLLYLTFLPLNFIVCSLRLIIKVRKSYNHQSSYAGFKNKWLNKLNNKIIGSKRWIISSFGLTLPLFCVMVLILTLLGQGPDGLSKVFTETSDWALSQKESTSGRIIIDFYN